MALPGDLYTALAALFLLFGVPLVLFGFIMLYTGYVRYDAEQYLEELEDATGEASDEPPAATDPSEPDRAGDESRPNAPRTETDAGADAETDRRAGDEE